MPPINSMFRALVAAVFVVLLISSPSQAASATEQIRHRLETAVPQVLSPQAGPPLHFAGELLERYEVQAFEPFWFDADGRPLPALAGLLDAIAAAADEGLDPASYHLEHLQAAQTDAANGADDAAEAWPASVRADIDVLASDAFMLLAADYRHGRVDPLEIDRRWHIPARRAANLPALGDAIVDAGAPQRLLAAELPVSPAYAALRERLRLQRELLAEAAAESASPAVQPMSAGPTLRPGMEDARVPHLRARLARLGDLANDAPAAADSLLYDDALATAVRAFQARHGLEPDGLIGQRTLAELNRTPAQRIDTLRVNLERWRWLPRDLGEEYILVNIAGFGMDVVSGGETVMHQRVIVGRPYRQTPVFTGDMTYLVLNPSWEVPHSLSVRDQLPLIRERPDYFDSMGFSVLQGWGADERRVDPASIDWNALGPANFPYRLRQAPGPRNALGTVKFMFPNRHSVYLHDTPSRGLFAAAERAFSSGCIRVEDPFALTEWLLAGEGRPAVKQPAAIRATLAHGRETTVRLGRSIPVHLLYWTAWVDAAGEIQYRGDLYQRDDPVLDALLAPRIPRAVVAGA